MSRRSRERAAPAAKPTTEGRLRRAAAFGLALACATGTVHVTSCQQSPTVVPVRSLSASGKVSFVCLYPEDPAERPLEACTAQLFTSVCEYEQDNDAGAADANVFYDDAGVAQATLFPHLYALVTQQATGQVAVVDTSALSNGVLDQNPDEPGAQFLPIGDGPTGIASTPGSVATFVGTSETGRQGIWAIPSSMIRPAESFGVPDMCIGPGDASVTPPQLNSWPACYLGATPGDLLLIDDPGLADGEQRPSCDDPYQFPSPTDSIALKETFHGRSKIVVAMPDQGGIAVLDAQEILNRKPGSFEPCIVERWLPLKVDLTGLAGQQALPTGLGHGSCSNPAPGTPPLATSYPSKPAGMSYADGKLYVADATAPVIHVVSLRSYVDGLGEVATPCNPIEEAPLFPTSLDQPERVVFTSKVSAASNKTPGFKAYLYATDVEDASVMVFDIGPLAESRRPLVRTKHPEWNPFQPRDRVKFTAPAADIILVERDVPAIDPVTGVAPGGVQCDPSPSAVTCVATGHNCSLGASYRTSNDYTTGAGPDKLRGEFAFAALTNGRVAVIDVADFDAPCRGPQTDTALAGCGSNASGLVTSAEVSCNVVSFGEVRSANYLGVGMYPGNHVPGIETYPFLYAADGSVIADTPTSTAPRMVATLPVTATGDLDIPAACGQTCDPLGCGNQCDNLPGCPLELFVGGIQTPLDVIPGQCSTACEPYGSPCTDTVASSDCCVGAGGRVCDPQTRICRPETCDVKGAPCNASTAGSQGSTCSQGNCTLSKCTPNGEVCTGTEATCAPQNCAWAAQTVNRAFAPGGIGTNDALAMNLEDPRVHVADQNWTVAYEGAIPGFDQKLATLALTTPSATAPWSATLTDPNSQFCDHGVLSALAFQQMLAVQPKPGLGLTAAELADYVQVTNSIPDPTDPYWTDNGGAGTTCDYPTCFGIFGPTDTPTLSTTRDLLIYEAYEDHLDLVPRGGENLATLQCCFPGAITFAVRVGHQWAVAGDQTGFIHHVVTDGTSGVCRNSCDPTLERKNARLVATAPTLVWSPIPDRPTVNQPGYPVLDPSPSFQNPMFRFGIVTGKMKCSADTDCAATAGAVCTQGVCTKKAFVTPHTTCKADADCGVTARCDTGGETCTKASDCATGACDVPKGEKSGTCGGACFSPGVVVTVPTERDSTFHFTTNGSFVPLLIGLATDTTSQIEPQSITYLGPTTELAVTDGYLSGLIMVSLQTASVSRSFF